MSSSEAPAAVEVAKKAADLPPLDAYNNSLVMPLHEFIEHPVVHDLLHNGGAMQVICLLLALQFLCNGYATELLERRSASIT